MPNLYTVKLRGVFEASILMHGKTPEAAKNEAAFWMQDNVDRCLRVESGGTDTIVFSTLESEVELVKTGPEEEP
jgi:hypothetical protein